MILSNEWPLRFKLGKVECCYIIVMGKQNFFSTIYLLGKVNNKSCKVTISFWNPTQFSDKKGLRTRHAKGETGC